MCAFKLPIDRHMNLKQLQNISRLQLYEANEGRHPKMHCLFPSPIDCTCYCTTHSACAGRHVMCYLRRSRECKLGVARLSGHLEGRWVGAVLIDIWPTTSVAFDGQRPRRYAYPACPDVALLLLFHGQAPLVLRHLLSRPTHVLSLVGSCHHRPSSPSVLAWLVLLSALLLC